MAPASMALSTSSLTEEERSVIAWPATRRLMEVEEIGLISGASSLSSSKGVRLLSSWVIVGVGADIFFISKEFAFHCPLC